MWENEYESWLHETGIGPNTAAQRVRFARSRHDAWGTLTPPSADVARWLNGYTGWSRRTYYGHLASLYAWMVETGQIDRSPLARVKRGAMPDPKPKPLSDAEVVRALSAAPNAHVRAWMMLAMFAGLRAFEIAKLHGRDVTEAAIYVVGKGGQDAHVPTHPQLWELAQTYPADGHWFPSPAASRDHITKEYLTNRVNATMKSAGLTGSIHRFRATYGTKMLRNGENLRVIQKLMRHKSIATTQHYLGVLDEELRGAVERLAA